MSSRKPGRPPKYDWDDKRAICHKLYVEDKLSANQIRKYFARHFAVPESDLPARNRFHGQFRKWGFPRRDKKWSAEEEGAIVERIRELFGENKRGWEIQGMLVEEGWEVDDYHFRALRRKHGMMMRNCNGYVAGQPGTGKKRKRKSGEDGGVDGERSGEDGDGQENIADAQEAPAQLDPEEEARRAQRLADLQLQSDQLLNTRKRRRRIRGYGHMGPDAPGLQPRYGSETSLDECKAFLHLDNETYVATRNQYAAICRSMSIVKMSSCADGVWQSSKDRLVRENPHLSSVLHPLQPDLDKRLNALNCICSDVTKRMRNETKTITIADANNILGLDPLQSKELRRMFYQVLEADHFTTVVACGKEHLHALENQWHAKSPLLSHIAAEGDPQKVRAVYLLSKDARKRYCDDQMKKNPERRLWQKQSHYGPGPGPAQGTAQNMAKSDSRTLTTEKRRSTNAAKNRSQQAPAAAASQQHAPATATATVTRAAAKTAAGAGVASALGTRPPLIPLGPAWTSHPVPSTWHPTSIADMVPPVNFDLDPLLAETAVSSNSMKRSPWPVVANHALDAGDGGGWPAEASNGVVGMPRPSGLGPPAADLQGQLGTRPAAAAIPAYFRLAPRSQIVGDHPKMWLGKLAKADIASLHAAATSKAGAARVTKVQGIVRNAGGPGGVGTEDSYVIENEDELEVYLEECGEKATFVVQLEGGYA